MEPGHEDREYPAPLRVELSRIGKPQWSPVMKTGNTAARPSSSKKTGSPQWSPVMKTGNTQIAQIRQAIVDAPQWSPVMKTGNTYTPREKNIQNAASMEPGHEDREYLESSQGAIPP